MTMESKKMTIQPIRYDLEGWVNLHMYVDSDTRSELTLIRLRWMHTNDALRNERMFSNCSGATAD